MIDSPAIFRKRGVVGLRAAAAVKAAVSSMVVKSSFWSGFSQYSTR